MPFIADVHTNDQISSSQWGNLIRDRVVHQFASIAERNAQAVPKVGMMAWCTTERSLFEWDGTGWMVLFEPWKNWADAAITGNFGGGQTLVWRMPGSTIVGTSGQQFLLDGARSVARYKRSVDTCEYVASFAVLNTAGPGTPQQTLWVNLPVGGIGGFGPAGGSVYGYGTGGGGTAYGWFQGTMQINGGNGYIVRGPTGGHSDTAPLNIEAGTFSTGTYFPAPGNDTIGHDSINVNVRYQTAVNYG